MTQGKLGTKELDVIVAGYGPVGRAVVEMLRAWSMRVTVIDANPRTIETQGSGEGKWVCGDVADEAVLESANISVADALILTIPDEAASLAACELARRLKPDLFIAVRTNHLSTGMLAKQVGADHVTVEEIVTAAAMRDAVIQKLVGP